MQQKSCFIERSAPSQVSLSSTLPHACATSSANKRTEAINFISRTQRNVYSLTLDRELVCLCKFG